MDAWNRIINSFTKKKIVCAWTYKVEICFRKVCENYPNLLKYVETQFLTR